MNAILQPLEGKYYGTKVRIIDGPYSDHEITIWLSIGLSGIEPSIRELEKYDVTQEQWDNNEQIGTWPMDTPDYFDYKPGSPIFARDSLVIYDSHFESRVSYEIAMGLLEVLKDIKS